MKSQLSKSHDVVITLLHFTDRQWRQIPQSPSVQHGSLSSSRWSSTVHSQQLPSYTISPYTISGLVSPPILFLLNAPHKYGYINSHRDVGYHISEELKTGNHLFLWKILSPHSSPFCAVNLPSQLIQWADPP